MSYSRDPSRVEEVLRRAGVVVVMNCDHVQTPEHLVTTMWEVHRAGYVAECTFRIDEGIIREGMQELVKRRSRVALEAMAQSADVSLRDCRPFVLGVGSIINPLELADALEMGFDMTVAPAGIEGGSKESWPKIYDAAAEHGVFLAPAAATPFEFSFYLERDDERSPHAIKIFPAESASRVGTILAPFVRPRHKNKIVMPTGGVDADTGPKFQAAILKAGFFPVLGMSAPLALVGQRKKPGDVDTIQESLAEFAKQFVPMPIAA